MGIAPHARPATEGAIGKERELKAKKTIRQMHHSPLSRDLAKFQRSVHSLELRLDRLFNMARDAETELLTLRRENQELRERLTIEALRKTPAARSPAPRADELFPDLPNGEGVG